MKKWFMPLFAMLIVLGLLQPAGAKGETTFFTGFKVLHSNGSAAEPYQLNEQLQLQLEWLYNGTAPAAFTLPDAFKASKDIEQVLTSKDGKSIGTLKVDADTGNVTVLLENASAIKAGTSGTTLIPVLFNKEKVTKAGTYNVSFGIGTPASLTVTEAAAGSGAIKVIALDSETKKKLAGSKFTIVNDTGKVVASLTTNSAGEASVPNLSFGTYTVTQTAAPAGYSVPVDPWELKLTTVLVTKEVLHVKAAGLTGALTVTAVEQKTATPIAGAEFELKTENGLFSKTMTTDAKGQASFTDLVYGNYTLTQTKTGDRYTLPGEPWTVVIGRQTPVEKKIENALITPYGALKITVTDFSSGKELKGAEYSLYNEKDEKTLVSKVVTDEEGIASFENLTAGSYTLVETDAAEGYKRSTEKTAVTIKSGETVELKLTSKKLASSAVSESTTTTTTTTKATSSGTLPQTGDESGMLYMFGGVLLAAGAFLLMKKGKRA